MNTLQLASDLDHFLCEDIGFGDITSDTLFPKDQQGKAEFVAKEDFIAAGMGPVAAEVFYLCNQDTSCTYIADGTRVQKGDIVFTAKGAVLDLLKAERVALNLVQRLSGIATLTAEFITQTNPLPVKIVDTRKTTPGLRMLEKYAVRVGGGNNHRFNLGDGVLIKDNHIAACGSISTAVERMRQNAPHTLKIEVEAETLAQVQECLSCKVDIIMLDNMDFESMRKAVKLAKNKALIEASGGIDINNVRQVAETGVDIISIGALTHSARACDISMRLR